MGAGGDGLPHSTHAGGSSMRMKELPPATRISAKLKELVLDIQRRAH